MKKEVIFFMVLFLIPLVLGDIIPIYVKPTNALGDLTPNTYYNYSINLSTTSACNTGFVLNHTELNLQTGKDGVGFINVSYDSSLSEIPTHACVYRDGVLDGVLNISSQIYNRIYAKNLNVSGNTTVQNISMGHNLTFADGQGVFQYTDVGNTFLINHGLYVTGANGFIDVATKGLFGGYVTIGETLNVSDNSWFEGNLTPQTTLTHSIGSGANRWLWGYFANISAENIDVSESIIALQNITSGGYFHGSGAYLSELNVTGDITGYTLNISYLSGHGGTGVMDLRGDPWYLGGAGFQIADGYDLIVGGNITTDFIWTNGINTTNLTIYDLTINDTISIWLSNTSTTGGLFATNGTSVYNDTAIAFGLGTNAPTNTLDIQGGLGIRSNVYAGYVAPTYGLYAEGYIWSGGVGGLDRLDIYEPTPNDEVAMRLSTADSGSGATDGMLLRLSHTNAPYVMLMNFENNNLTFGTNGQEVLNLTADGNAHFNGNITAGWIKVDFINSTFGNFSDELQTDFLFVAGQSTYLDKAKFHEDVVFEKGVIVGTNFTAWNAVVHEANVTTKVNQSIAGDLWANNIYITNQTNITLNNSNPLFNKPSALDWSNISGLDFVVNDTSAVQKLINNTNLKLTSLTTTGGITSAGLILAQAGLTISGAQFTVNGQDSDLEYVSATDIDATSLDLTQNLTARNGTFIGNSAFYGNVTHYNYTFSDSPFYVDLSGGTRVDGGYIVGSGNFLYPTYASGTWIGLGSQPALNFTTAGNTAYGYAAGIYPLGTQNILGLYSLHSSIFVYDFGPGWDYYTGTITNMAANYITTQKNTATGDVLNSYGIYIEQLGAGSTQTWAMKDLSTRNWWIAKDKASLGFGTGASNSPDFNISYDGTNPIFTSTLGNNTFIFRNKTAGNYADILVSDVKTATSVFDKSKGSALDLIKDADEYKNPDGSINHSSFYGYETMVETDEDNCWEVFDRTTYVNLSCTTCPLPNDIKPNGKENIDWVKSDLYDIECGTKEISVVSMFDEIDLLRQALAEQKDINANLTARIEALEGGLSPKV